MDEDYWNASSVTKKASQQGIFDMDGSNAMDEHILDSSRSTTTTGAVSNRFRPTTAPSPASAPKNSQPPPPTTTITTTRATPISQPKFTSPSPAPPMQVPRPFAQSTESARFGRSPVSSTSNDTHSSSQWLPNAEEYPDQTTKDRSTQYDREMELLCKALLENEPVKLDNIRDYDKKASLLRKAVSFNTPSVTVPVMIFLENTLSRPLFYELIKQYPSAVKNYINMAKLRFENEYHIAMLKQFDRNEDVAMIRLRQMNQINDVNTKMAMLDQAATELESHPWWRLQVAEYKLLLRKQRELQTPANQRTVLETYKTIYDADFRRNKQSRMLDKSTVDRSKEFETTFNMSPELIMCGKLSVIMQCGLRAHYDDFVHQAIHQGIFGKKYIIAPEYLADMVYNWAIASGEGQEKASDKAEKFLTMIPDPNKRIYFAEKFQNFDVAMDTIVNNLRDRGQLEVLRRRMPADHRSYNRATSLLENTKWRS